MNSFVRASAFIITLSTLLFWPSPQARAEEAAPKTEASNSFDDVVDLKSFASIIKSSEAGKKLLETCRDESRPAGTDFYDCIQKSWNNESLLTAGDKEEISKQLQNVKVTYDKDGKQVFEKEKIDTLKLNPTSVKITSGNDPSVKALREHLSKQLSDALYGELNKNEGKMTKRKLVDHQTFYDLFETQVGQNIILAVSDYCMSAHPVYPVSEDTTKAVGSPIYITNINLEDDSLKPEKILNNNLEKLKSDYGDSSKFEELSGNYKTCITQIAKICKLESSVKYTLSPKKEENAQTPPKQTSPSDASGDSSDITQRANDARAEDEKKEVELGQASINRACLTAEYIDRGRAALINISKIKEAIPEDSSGGNFFAENDVYRGGRGKNEKSIQQLAVHTSSDIQKSGMQEAAQKSVEKIDECLDSQDEGTCKNYVDNKLEEKQELYVDEFLRAKAQEDRLRASLEEDDKAVVEYLKEEGYSDEQAQAVIDEDFKGKKEDAINAIVNRYAKQKQAVIDALGKKIEATNVGGDADFAAKEKAITTVKNDIQSKPEKLAKLLFYSNLASSFITVESDGPTPDEKTSGVNTVAAFSELSSASEQTSARSPSDTTTGIGSIYGPQDQLDQSLERLKELKDSNAESGKSVDEASKSDLKVEEINEFFLKY